jgi:hypothetical protein
VFTANLSWMVLFVLAAVLAVEGAVIALRRNPDTIFGSARIVGCVDGHTSGAGSIRSASSCLVSSNSSRLVAARNPKNARFNYRVCTGFADGARQGTAKELFPHLFN